MDFCVLIFFQNIGNIHNTLKFTSLLGVDVVELWVGELELGELGHVNTLTATVVLGQLVQLRLQLASDFR